MTKLDPKKLPELDPNLKVYVCPYGTSTSPNLAIYQAQHICVCEDEELYVHGITDSKAGELVVKHLLKGGKGHYSPLRFASVNFTIQGFDHNTIMQFVRHQDSAHLVQSMRYTGNRIVKFVEDGCSRYGAFKLFYFRPSGYTFKDRYGQSYEMTEEGFLKSLDITIEACRQYSEAVKDGVPFEQARYLLPTNFRQNYTLSCDLQALLHLLDQRTKADSQLEAQALASILFQKLELLTPEIAAWYKENRYGKALLAP